MTYLGYAPEEEKKDVYDRLYWFKVGLCMEGNDSDSEVGSEGQAAEEEDGGDAEVKEDEIDCDDVSSMGWDVARTDLIPPRPGIDTVFELKTRPKFVGTVYITAEVVRALLPRSLIKGGKKLK